MRLGSTLSMLALTALLASCATPTAEERAYEDIRDTTVIPNLGSYDGQVQSDAVNRMLNILANAPDIGSNLLLASLRDPVHDQRTKMVCAWLLSTVGDRRALPSLMGYLGEGTNASEGLVREAVVSYGASVVPAVAQVLEEGNDLARIAAAEVLVDLRTEDAFRALASRLDREPEPRVRFLIICGIAADSQAEAVPRLESALVDPDAMNRELAWDALSRKLGVPATIEFDPNASDVERDAQLSIYRAWRSTRRASP